MGTGLGEAVEAIQDGRGSAMVTITSDDRFPLGRSAGTQGRDAVAATADLLVATGIVSGELRPVVRGDMVPEWWVTGPFGSDTIDLRTDDLAFRASRARVAIVSEPDANSFVQASVCSRRFLDVFGSVVESVQLHFRYIVPWERPIESLSGGLPENLSVPRYGVGLTHCEIKASYTGAANAVWPAVTLRPSDEHGWHAMEPDHLEILVWWQAIGDDYRAPGDVVEDGLHYDWDKYLADLPEHMTGAYDVARQIMAQMQERS